MIWARETADISYTDVDGTLTRLLINAKTWANARPHYFVEVNQQLWAVARHYS
jgi:hypothetical protein